MNKKLILLFVLIILIIFSGLYIYFSSKTTTGRAIFLNQYSYTTAICNSSNFCQDYKITCNDNEPINAVPITGAVIQHKEEWKDPRNSTELCT